jgi:aryl-alcohol dehydrogenase-like predicted oxidoreductase
MNVRQIPLGRTSLRVCEMVFGGAPIGGLYAPVPDDQAAATLEAAWAAGIRAFDTAPHYGAGLSEQRIGRFLAGRPREEFVLSTKIGRRLVPATGDVEGAAGFYGTPRLARVRDYSRDGALAALEASLLRHPAVTAVVVGARTVTEVTENVSYLAATVPAELFGELAAERLTPDDGLMPAHGRQAPD